MNADEIRYYVARAYIVPARKQKRRFVVVRAGDVHAKLNLKDRMPAVCGALDAWIFQLLYGVTLIKRTGPKQGANVEFTFQV